jgi:hypothetical protein
MADEIRNGDSKVRVVNQHPPLPPSLVTRKADPPDPPSNYKSSIPGGDGTRVGECPVGTVSCAISRNDGETGDPPGDPPSLVAPKADPPWTPPLEL